MRKARFPFTQKSRYKRLSSNRSDLAGDHAVILALDIIGIWEPISSKSASFKPPPGKLLVVFNDFQIFLPFFRMNSWFLTFLHLKDKRFVVLREERTATPTAARRMQSWGDSVRRVQPKTSKKKPGTRTLGVLVYK